MDRISSTGSPKAPARSWPSVEIDSEAGRLGPGRVFVQSTPIGYVCAGFGDGARLLRFAFEQPQSTDATAKNENYETNPIFAAACDRLEKAVAAGGIAKARRLGLKIPLGAIDDPALRRLAIASALIKSGFDPDQARDEDGRWTSGGGGGSAARNVSVASVSSSGDNSTASAVTPLNVSAPALAVGGATAVAGAEALGLPGAGAGWSLWSEGALSLLPRIAGLAGPIGLIGGLIFAPANRSGELESSGTLPDHPDISYFRSEGRLQIFRTDADGQHTLLYDGYPSDDDYYRDADGHVIGRSLGLAKGFVLDPSAASTLSPPTMDARAKEKEKEEDPAVLAAKQKLLAEARATVRAADPAELCPDPELDTLGSESASPRAKAYQMQVTHLPYGVAFYLNGVNFDGCRYWGDGTMLEAKGLGLEQHFGPDGMKEYFKGMVGFMKQMTDQAEAARKAGKALEWHVAEKPVADFLRGFVREMRFTNVKVVDEEALQKFFESEPEDSAQLGAVELVPFLVAKAWLESHVR